MGQQASLFSDISSSFCSENFKFISRNFINRQTLMTFDVMFFKTFFKRETSEPAASVVSLKERNE